MAVTERDRPSAAREPGALGGVVAAALSLPGLMPAIAVADLAPQHAMIELKTEHYQDSQKGAQRVKVDEPGIFVLTPLGEHFSAAGSFVYDAVSGASPRYYSAMSGASKMRDRRYAGNGELTYYADRSSWGIGYSRSKENDFDASSISVDGIVSTQDNNTAFNFGLEAGRDKITPTGQPDVNEHRTTYAGIVGITQAVSVVDLVQIQGGYGTAHGYFSDPYKLFDNRPRRRNYETASLRWNHHISSLGATVRTSYRFYHDTYGIDSHTFDVQWVQPFAERWAITPGIRYYTQNSAFFYIDPPTNSSPFPTIPDGMLSSLDQRLSAFGAWAVNTKLDWHISEHWTTDLKGELYEQKSSYRFIGRGSPGLDRFQYYQVQFGITYHF